MVKFIIAGMDDQPGRRFDAQANRIRDGVADMEEIDLERADLNHVTGLNRVQICLAQSSHCGPV